MQAHVDGKVFGIHLQDDKTIAQVGVSLKLYFALTFPNWNLDLGYVLSILCLCLLVLFGALGTTEEVFFSLYCSAIGC
jgi:hypothetical protein